MDTRLILMEGLPCTGKLTNAGGLRDQLERHGKCVEWVHEVTRPNPLLLVPEACFTKEDFARFCAAHPQAQGELNRLATVYENTVSVDLLQAEWDSRAALGEEAYAARQARGVWGENAGDCGAFIQDKWRAFAKAAQGQADTVYVVDSGLFQAHIFGFLLQNRPYAALERYVLALLSLVAELRPILFYLHRQTTAEAIAFMEERRGEKFFAELWQRDNNKQYYQDKPQGAEAVRMFFRDYAAWANKLFAAAPCAKQAVLLQGENWPAAEKQMLDFLGVNRRPAPAGKPPQGVYRSKAGLEMTISGTTLRDPEGRRRALAPKGKDTFNMEAIPTVLRFDGTGRCTVESGQITVLWTVLGTVYERVEG